MARSIKAVVVLSASMLVASVAAMALHPTLSAGAPVPELGRVLPSTVADWKLQPNILEQASLEVARDGTKSMDQPYDQTVTRNYGDPEGRVVMLAVAYTNVQAQEVKTHRPEVCYPAQGYAIEQRFPANLSTIRRQASNGPPLEGIRMLASQRGRLEAVVFWIRTGDSFTDSGLGARMEIVREGLRGHTTDGVLVRASMLISNPTEAPQAYATLEGFLRDLVAASPNTAREILVR